MSNFPTLKLRSHCAGLSLRPRGFGEQGKKGIYFRGTGEQGQILKGTGEKRQYWGAGNIRKQFLDFGGTGEQANLFQGNKRTGTPPLFWKGLFNTTGANRDRPGRMSRTGVDRGDAVAIPAHSVAQPCLYRDIPVAIKTPVLGR